GAALSRLARVAVDGVLVEGDEHVQVIPVVVDLLLRQAQAEPGVAAADQRLVAVVGEKVQPEASGGPGQGVARPIQTVARGACDSHRDLRGHRHSSSPMSVGYTSTISGFMACSTSEIPSGVSFSGTRQVPTTRWSLSAARSWTPFRRPIRSATARALPGRVSTTRLAMSMACSC